MDDKRRQRAYLRKRIPRVSEAVRVLHSLLKEEFKLSRSLSAYELTEHLNNSVLRYFGYPITFEGLPIPFGTLRKSVVELDAKKKRLKWTHFNPTPDVPAVNERLDTLLWVAQWTRAYLAPILEIGADRIQTRPIFIFKYDRGVVRGMVAHKIEESISRSGRRVSLQVAHDILDYVWPQ